MGGTAPPPPSMIPMAVMAAAAGHHLVGPADVIVIGAMGFTRALPELALVLALAAVLGAVAAQSVPGVSHLPFVPCLLAAEVIL